MSIFDPSARQYGVRPAPDVVALLEEEATRLRIPPTTLATQLLELAAREHLGGEAAPQTPLLSVSDSLLRDLMTRVHFVVLLLGSQLPVSERQALYEQAVDKVTQLLESQQGGGR